MDERTQDAVDAELAHRLLFNEHTFEHPKFGAVKLRRPTMGQERLIAEARRRQYQRDMQDPEILSREELLRIAERRGIWSEAQEQRIAELTQRVGTAMVFLDRLGFKKPEQLLEQYRNLVDRLYAFFPEDAEGRAAVLRYFALDLESTDEDRQMIVDKAPSTEVDDVLEEADGVRKQLKLLEDFALVKGELDKLQAQQSQLFLDSVESRAARAEEMARLYYCSSHAESGKPLWPKPDQIWDAPAEDIEPIMLETSYFLNGITSEQRDMLGRFGFRTRLAGTPDSLGDSQGQPQSNSDGESQANAPTASSEATASPTDPSTPSSSPASSAG
jgi:hypothetical protein